MQVWKSEKQVTVAPWVAVAVLAAAETSSLVDDVVDEPPEQATRTRAWRFMDPPRRIDAVAARRARAAPSRGPPNDAGLAARGCTKIAPLHVARAAASRTWRRS